MTETSPPVTIRVEFTDYHRGEHFGRVFARDAATDAFIGYVDFSAFGEDIYEVVDYGGKVVLETTVHYEAQRVASDHLQGYPDDPPPYDIRERHREIIHIKMIEVAENRRREGIGRAMIQALQNALPGYEVETGLQLEDGVPFFNAIQGESEPLQSSVGVHDDSAARRAPMLRPAVRAIRFLSEPSMRAAAVEHPRAASPVAQATGGMTVSLGHVSNPDIDSYDGYWSPPQDDGGFRDVPVESLSDAVRTCRGFIEENGLGGGNWGPDAGIVKQNGNPVAKISYNGRVWRPGPWPQPEIDPETGAEIPRKSPGTAAPTAARDLLQPETDWTDAGSMASTARCPSCGQSAPLNPRNFVGSCRACGASYSPDRPNSASAGPSLSGVAQAFNDVFEDDFGGDAAECPACGEFNFPMGPLGKRMHYSCRACGMEYSHDTTLDPGTELGRNAQTEQPTEWRRVRRITSHVGKSRFMSECDPPGAEDGPQSVGVVPRQAQIPSPYAYSPYHDVLRWHGKNVIIVETRHKTYDVFEVPANVEILPEEPETQMSPEAREFVDTAFDDEPHNANRLSAAFDGDVASPPADGGPETCSLCQAFGKPCWKHEQQDPAFQSECTLCRELGEPCWKHRHESRSTFAPSLSSVAKNKRIKSQWGRASITISDKCPTQSIDYIVNRLHVGTSDAEVEADIRGRATGRDNWTPELIDEAVRYALWRHAENRGQYEGVMGGGWGYKGASESEHGRRLSAVFDDDPELEGLMEGRDHWRGTLEGDPDLRDRMKRHWTSQRDESERERRREEAHPYDTAVPQGWLDHVIRTVGSNPAGHIVWSYKTNRVMGEPVAIDSEGDRILAALNTGDGRGKLATRLTAGHVVWVDDHGRGNDGKPYVLPHQPGEQAFGISSGEGWYYVDDAGEIEGPFWSEEEANQQGAGSPPPTSTPHTAGPPPDVHGESTAGDEPNVTAEMPDDDETPARRAVRILSEDVSAVAA